MNRKLYRSQTDKMLGGVCGGLADYLGIDAVFVRLFFVLLALGDGIGFVLYFALWILVPVDPAMESGAAGGDFSERARNMGDDMRAAVRNPHPQTGLIIGSALIFLGVVSLVDALNIHWLDWVNFDVFWPVLLIAGGIIWIMRGVRGE